MFEAKTEQEQMQRIATLFDVNNVRNNNLSALTRLKELQLSDGSWSWFKGMSGNMFITLSVLELNARLAQLTNAPLANNAKTMQTAALNFLHQQFLQEYRQRAAAQRKNYG